MRPIGSSLRGCVEAALLGYICLLLLCRRGGGSSLHGPMCKQPTLVLQSLAKPERLYGHRRRCQGRFARGERSGYLSFCDPYDDFCSFAAIFFAETEFSAGHQIHDAIRSTVPI